METTLTATVTLPIKIETNFIQETNNSIKDRIAYIHVEIPRQVMEVPVDIKVYQDAPIGLYRMLIESASIELMHELRSALANQIRNHLKLRGTHD
jgi:hypothetical protein